jgi:hypothetical protein
MAPFLIAGRRDSQSACAETIASARAGPARVIPPQNVVGISRCGHKIGVLTKPASFPATGFVPPKNHHPSGGIVAKMAFIERGYRFSA